MALLQILKTIGIQRKMTKTNIFELKTNLVLFKFLLKCYANLMKIVMYITTNNVTSFQKKEIKLETAIDYVLKTKV